MKAKAAAPQTHASMRNLDGAHLGVIDWSASGCVRWQDGLVRADIPEGCLVYVRPPQLTVSQQPFTGKDLSDIACMLDWEKNLKNSAVKQLLTEVVDKLHTAADLILQEARRT